MAPSPKKFKTSDDLKRISTLEQTVPDTPINNNMLPEMSLPEGVKMTIHKISDDYAPPSPFSYAMKEQSLMREEAELKAKHPGWSSPSRTNLTANSSNNVLDLNKFQLQGNDPKAELSEETTPNPSHDDTLPGNDYLGLLIDRYERSGNDSYLKAILQHLEDILNIPNTPNNSYSENDVPMVENNSPFDL